MKTGLIAILSWLVVAEIGTAASPGEPPVKVPNLLNNIHRALRYSPQDGDFVIDDGQELFNRPLYGGNTAFRVDAGDRPQFGIYLPGRGGILRLGIKTAGTAIWLDEAERIVARYRPGSMLYDITDPILGRASLSLTAICSCTKEGLIVNVLIRDANEPVNLIWAFGGANGQRGRRNVDIGAEDQPVASWWQLRPQYCIGNRFTIGTSRFRLDFNGGQLFGITQADTKMDIADANCWPSIAMLIDSAGSQTDQPLIIGRSLLNNSRPYLLAILTRPSEVNDLALLFHQAQQTRSRIAQTLKVNTPDPFINAAVHALNIAADAIWDEPTGTVMHGAVAWRSRLLGWRGPYAMDAIGWHDRARRHILYWAGRQNTSPISEVQPHADASANLSRCEAALHSNGDISNSHYDMNLVYIDMVFRHLLWTGDLDLARRLWPVIERHLAWERRLFRRPFGPEGLPLYEAYACFWASDDIAYNGGGTAVASAYNYWHNLMAATLAKALGKDPCIYQQEASLIRKAIKQYLWVAEKGVLAEYRDILGLGLAHQSPGLWSFYHAIDSNVISPLEAWQASRFVDTQIPHIPVRGPGVPEGDWFQLATTNWMPYSWSVNNVVMAESAHTALAFWQIGRPDQAWLLFKGAILDSMCMGLCPGNLGMCTGYDVYRREAQRDFADAVGTVARAIVEGLFGIRPDAIHGRILIRPGFPADWNHASITHPTIRYEFYRKADEDLYIIEPNFWRPQALVMQVAARKDLVAAVLVNGKPVAWQTIGSAIARPMIEFSSPPNQRFTVQVRWQGDEITKIRRPDHIQAGQQVRFAFEHGLILDYADPQGILEAPQIKDGILSARLKATDGQHCLFIRVRQGQMDWWEPVHLEMAQDEQCRPFTIPDDPEWVTLDITGLFNDRLINIFSNEYLSPRSPYCSLSTPKQGIGSWCRPHASVQIDDSGLRARATKNGGIFRLPQGLPFAIPGPDDHNNVLFLSRWDNYPNDVTIPLSGSARHLYLLMAGTTGPMQSRFDNAEVIVHYIDGTGIRLALHNPTNWWPIEQDYFIDDFQFRRPQPIPPRIHLKTGQVYIYDPEQFKGKGGPIPGGAAAVIDVPLDPNRQLGSITIRVLANEIIVGLMAITLAK